MGVCRDPDIILKPLARNIKTLGRSLTYPDLSGRNVAFTSNSLSKLTEEALFEVLGPSETEKLTRRDGKALSQGVPGQLVKATGRDNWIDEDDEDIQVFDSGEAFPKGAEPEKAPPTFTFKVARNDFHGQL